nr:hypothetical protein [uncultured Bacillus sp.]
MSMDEAFLEVNDYLDLYLLAGSLNDKSWQQQIIEKLKDAPKGNSKKEITTTIEKLTKEYRACNTDIIDLYRQLYQDPKNPALSEMFSKLEQKRKFLSKKLFMEKNRLRHYSY